MHKRPKLKKENIRNLLKTKSSKLRRRSGLFSPITRRILAINILALGFLAVGILYLDEYKKNLIEAELSGLLTQADMFAVAISEGAVARAPSGRYSVSQISNQMVRRLVKTTGTRARLFAVDGGLIADSRRLLGSLGNISIETLPPPENPKSFINWTLGLFEPLVDQEPDANRYPLYKENIQQTAKDYPEVIAALSGDRVKTVRTLNPDQLILSVAVPVQRYKQVLGSLLVTKDSKSIEQKAKSNKCS